jgi:lipoprotein NlpI
MSVKHNKKTQKLPSTPKKKTRSYNVSGMGKYYFPLFLVLLVSFFAYLPVLHNTFVNADDDLYIQNNLLIRTINIKDTFSRFDMGNYHPLTMLIYSIEYHFFGLSERGFHAVNLLIHLLNVILVFHAVSLLSEKTEVALIAALLFGIHPLHVESVAWASELKDLLYAFFFLSSYILYLKYFKYSQRKYYFYCLLLLILSFLSKGLAASFPLVLILTDYFKGRKINGKCLVEKIPFFVLSIVFGVVAIYAQRSFGAIHTDYFSFPLRLVFASYGFITYLIKLLLPLKLSSFYPYPDMAGIGGTLPAQYYIYPLLLLGLFVAVFYSLRLTRKIFFGLGFFTITILLVLQLLPVGGTIMADRYCYLPSFGIFFLAAEGIFLLWNQKGSTRKWRLPAMMIIFIALVFYTFKTYSQCGVWKNSLSLWNNVIGLYKNVPDAYYNRGFYFVQEKKFEEALNDINKTIELDPEYSAAYNVRGNIFNNAKRHAEALDDFNKAIALNPNASAYNNRGLVFRDLHRYEDALSDFNKAIVLQPDFYEGYNDRGIVLSELKRFEASLNDFNKAIELDPKKPTAYYNRGAAEYNIGKKDLACRDFQQAAILGHPDAANTYSNLCH